MAELNILQVSQTPPQPMLEEFKQYASVPDNSRDALLNGLLQTALLKVQEYADTALVECKCSQRSIVQADGAVKLYLGGGAIESIRDVRTGEAVDYSYGSAMVADGIGTLFCPQSAGSTVEIIFTTKPSLADRLRLKTVAFRYATALYDGDDVTTLNGILNEVF